MVRALLLEGGPLEGAADQEQLLVSKKKIENMEKGASVRGCVGRVVGVWCQPSTWPWCPRTWSAGLPPPGSSGPRLLRWQHQTVLSVPGGQPRFLRHDELSNCPH